MKNILVLIILFTTLNAFSKTYYVSSQTELDNAISNIQGGDTIILLNSGSPYKDIRIKIKFTANSLAPVVIKAETVGDVILTGNSRIQMGGAYIFIEGLTFSGTDAPDKLTGNGAIEFRYSTDESDWCYNCKIKNILFNAYNQPDNQKTEVLKWVRIYGQDNSVVNCSFINKHGVGNCITIERPDDKANRALIYNNYFANRTPVTDANGKVLNDQDAIRVGSSTYSLSSSNSIIYNNYFYNWNGEAEIISNKSGENEYFGNTFQKCVGTLTLRHGTHCQVYNNWFFGENLPKSGGIRIIDSDHKIYNNYFQDLDADNSKVAGAINLYKGDEDFVSGGVLSSYAICEDNLIAFNTIVNCDIGIWIGPDVSDREYAPKNLEIKNNLLIKCSNAVLASSLPEGNNIIQGNIKQSGQWWSGFDTNENLSTDSSILQLDENNGFYRIFESSKAVSYGYTTSYTPNFDIMQGQRDAQPDAGAEEYNGKGNILPYTQNDLNKIVGVIPDKTTGLNEYLFENIKIFPNPTTNTLSIKSNYSFKKIVIYNVKGMKVIEKKFNNTIRLAKIAIDNLESGIYYIDIVKETNIVFNSKFIKL